MSLYAIFTAKVASAYSGLMISLGYASAPLSSVIMVGVVGAIGVIAAGYVTYKAVQFIVKAVKWARSPKKESGDKVQKEAVADEPSSTLAAQDKTLVEKVLDYLNTFSYRVSLNDEQNTKLNFLKDKLSACIASNEQESLKVIVEIQKFLVDNKFDLSEFNKIVWIPLAKPSGSASLSSTSNGNSWSSSSSSSSSNAVTPPILPSVTTSVPVSVMTAEEQANCLTKYDALLDEYLNFGYEPEPTVIRVPLEDRNRVQIFSDNDQSENLENVALETFLENHALYFGRVQSKLDALKQKSSASSSSNSSERPLVPTNSVPEIITPEQEAVKEELSSSSSSSSSTSSSSSSSLPVLDAAPLTPTNSSETALVATNSGSEIITSKQEAVKEELSSSSSSSSSTVVFSTPIVLPPEASLMFMFPANNKKTAQLLITYVPELPLVEVQQASASSSSASAAKP